MSERIIDVRNLWFSYENETILRKVNIGVDSGDFVSIIGPNGGGKTTLAKIILGLLHPDSGEVLLFGQSPGKVRTRIGYVPQYSNFDTRFPVSVMDVVLMGKMTRAIGFYTSRDKSDALHALSDVGLEGFERRPFPELSGGQRQRVLIARALCGSPDILLLDEPTASVDTAVEDKLKTVLTALHDRLTILMITHDLGFVSDQINKIICVNKQVHIHESKKVTPAMIEELYGSDVHYVDHTSSLGACPDD